MKTATLRNFRIDNTLWNPAKALAEELGVSMTIIVSTALRAFVRVPQITLGKPEEVTMPKHIHHKADELNDAVLKALQKKRR